MRVMIQMRILIRRLPNTSLASVRVLVRLNTDEFRNALRLNDAIRRGVPHTFHACAAKVWFGGAYHPMAEDTSHPKRAAPIRRNSQGAERALIFTCSTRVCFGDTTTPRTTPKPPPPERGRCRDSGGGGAMSGYTFLSIDSSLHRERHILTPRRRIPPRRRCRECGRWGGGTLGSCTSPPRGL